MRMRPLVSVLAAVATCALVGVPTPADAHTELLSSSPAEGAVVAASTDRLVLIFGESLLRVGSDVVVQGPDGDEVTLGDPTILDKSVEARLEPLSSGRHRIAYRVVGTDGHAIAGTYSFTVAAAGARASSATTTSLGEATASTAGSVAPPLAESASADSPLSRWLLLASGLTALLVALPALLRRRRGTRRGHRRVVDA